jgi:hypothetical protein
MHAGRIAYEISSEKVKPCTERRAQNETFAPLPSFLQGHASIDMLSAVLLLLRTIEANPANLCL